MTVFVISELLGECMCMFSSSSLVNWWIFLCLCSLLDVSKKCKYLYIRSFSHLCIHKPPFPDVTVPRAQVLSTLDQSVKPFAIAHESVCPYFGSLFFHSRWRNRCTKLCLLGGFPFSAGQSTCGWVWSAAAAHLWPVFMYWVAPLMDQPLSLYFPGSCSQRPSWWL